MKTIELTYLIENAEQSGGLEGVDAGHAAREELHAITQKLREFGNVSRRAAHILRMASIGAHAKDADVYQALATELQQAAESTN